MKFGYALFEQPNFIVNANPLTSFFCRSTGSVRYSEGWQAESCTSFYSHPAPLSAVFVSASSYSKGEETTRPIPPSTPWLRNRRSQRREGRQNRRPRIRRRRTGLFV